MGQQRLRAGCWIWAALGSVLGFLVALVFLGPFAMIIPVIILGLAWWLTREVGASKATVTAPTELSSLEFEPFGDFDPGPPIREGRGVLVFEYADVNGVVTDRVVSPWIEYRLYIRGHCLTAEGPRTFRKNRVLHWSVGKDSLSRP